MAKQVKLKLTVDGRQVDATLDNSEKSLRRINAQSKSATDSFAKWGNIVTGINQGLGVAQKLVGMANKAIDAYKKQEQAEKQLEQALGKRSEKLLDLSSSLQQVTTFGDEQIIQAQSLIAAFVKDEEQIGKVTEATLDLAAAKGMDLKNAADLVSKTLGSSTNAMSRYGIEVNGAVGSSQRLESMVGNLTEAFGGQARAIAETDTGKLTQAQNRLGDSMERVGEIAAKILVPGMQAVAAITEGVLDFFSAGEEQLRVYSGVMINQRQEIELTKQKMKGVRDEAIRQKQEFEVLAGSFIKLKEKTNRSNIEQQAYLDIIKELQEKYPNYLENVDLQKDSINNVKTALDDARISLQKFVEKMLYQKVIKDRQKELTKIIAAEVDARVGQIKYEEKMMNNSDARVRRKYIEMKEHTKGFTESMKNMSDERKKELREEIRIAKEVIAELMDIGPPGGDGDGDGDGKKGKAPPLPEPPRAEADVGLQEFTDEQLGKDEWQQKYDRWASARDQYYNSMKSKDDEYYNYRMQKINQDVEQLRRAGLSEVQLEKYKSERIKQLDKNVEKQKYEQLTSAKDQYYSLMKYKDDDYYNYRKQKINEDVERKKEAGLSEEKLEKYKNEKIKQLDKEKEEIKKQQLNQRLNNVSNAMGQISGVFAKHTAAYKAMAITQTIIDTYQAAQSAYKAMAGIPIVGPALGAAAAAAAVIQGFQRVQSIKNQESSGYAEGGLVSGNGRIIRVNERGEEFVNNAESTKRNYAALDAMNKGRENTIGWEGFKLVASRIDEQTNRMEQLERNVQLNMDEFDRKYNDFKNVEKVET